jgi:DIRP
MFLLFTSRCNARYNRNEFVRAAAKLGVRTGTLLTRQEWSAVRKRIPNKPRRFSRRFIASQMSERNKYRNSLRMLQNDPNPAMAQRLGFDYEVPARIPIGATVTAFNSRYRMLERGVVLSYEEARGKYYVKLPYSNHFCSDFDVARHGLSDVVMPAPEMVLGDMERKLEFGYTHAERLLQHNATMGPMIESTVEPRRWTVDDEIRGLFRFAGFSAEGKRKSGVATPKPSLPAPAVAEKVAEYEMLVSVMISLEAATERKRMILDRLESIHNFAAGNQGRLPDHLHQHYPWLLANLDSINEVVSTAHSCLQNLYGSIYLPSSSITMDRFEILESMLGQKLSTREYSADQDQQQQMDGVAYGDSRDDAEDDDAGQTGNDGGQRNLFGGAADQWLARLLLDSEDIGGRLVSELHWPDMSDENAQFMHNRIYDISSLLLALSFGLDGATGPRRTDSTAANVAVAIAQKEVTSLTFPPAPLTAGNNAVGNEDADVYVGTLNARNLAMDELKQALDLLNAEHTAASVHASLGKRKA